MQMAYRTTGELARRTPPRTEGYDKEHQELSLSSLEFDLSIHEMR